MTAYSTYSTSPLEPTTSPRPSMHVRPRMDVSPDGPVLLATKPFGGLDAPLAVARWIAAREDRELRVVSVLEPDEGIGTASVPPLTSRYYDNERTALAAQIRRELGDDAAAARAKVDVLQGSSVQTVVDAARECGARVIVVGSGRHNPIGRYVYGERALQIVGRSGRPVLVVPDGTVPSPVSTAVVALDFNPASVRAAIAALTFLSPGGRLVVVHVKPGVTLNGEMAGWWNDADERRCADRFAQFMRLLPRLPDVTVDSKFLRGDIVPTVMDYAAAQGAGLIACGRLGHSLIARVFVGSVSSALIREARLPVLVAPELPSDVALH
jgi:nucleotide-binding universal stress UspA family protein